MKTILNKLGELILEGMARHGLVLFAFNAAPNSWLPNYTSNAGAHTLSMNTLTAGTAMTLPLLDDAHADANTGDIRTVTWAMLEELWQQWNAIGTAGQPTEMTMLKTSTVNSVNGLTTARYQVTIVTAPAGFTVATEGSGS